MTSGWQGAPDIQEVRLGAGFKTGDFVKKKSWEGYHRTTLEYSIMGCKIHFFHPNQCFWVEVYTTSSEERASQDTLVPIYRSLCRYSRAAW